MDVDVGQNLFLPLPRAGFGAQVAFLPPRVGAYFTNPERIAAEVANILGELEFVAYRAILSPTCTCFNAQSGTPTVLVRR